MKPLSESYRLALLEQAIEEDWSDARLSEQEQRLTSWLDSSSWHGEKQPEAVLLSRFFRGDLSPYVGEEAQERMVREAFRAWRKNLERRVSSNSQKEWKTPQEVAQGRALLDAYKIVQKPGTSVSQCIKGIEHQKELRERQREGIIYEHGLVDGLVPSSSMRRELHQELKQLCSGRYEHASTGAYDRGYGRHDSGEVRTGMEPYYPLSIGEDYELLYTWALDFFQAGIDCLEQILEDVQANNS